MLFFLMLETGMLGVFLATDLVLFYIFWEFTLIPMYFLIGMWGGERRIYAAVKFFLFTMAGSVLMLLAMIYLGLTGQHLLAACPDRQPRGLRQRADLAVPGLCRCLRHQGADVAAAHLAAGRARRSANRRLGHPGGRAAEDGRLRFPALQPAALPQATLTLAPWIAGLAVIGIIYGAIVSYQQKDVKKLVAYSSVSHLGFVMLGIFALNPQSLSGSILQMVNHGLSTGALFLIVGMLYERRHTREMSAYGGIWKVVPVMGALMLFVTLSSAGLPGLNGFVGEFTILLGSFWLAGARQPLVRRGGHAGGDPGGGLPAGHVREGLPRSGDAAKKTAA